MIDTLPVTLAPTAEQIPNLGTLPVAMFPALTGDVTTPGGSLATTLATVNASPGTYTYASLTVNGKGLVTSASSGAAPEVPLTFSTGLTRTVNTITVNTSQNIATLSNLTSNGYVKTSGGGGTLGVSATVAVTDLSAAIDLGATGAGGATGTLAAGRFPALTGDVTTVAGALATTLATVNASAGTYASANVTVNAKGLVTTATAGPVPGFSLQAAGSTISPADSTTVYFGALPTLAPSTTAALMKVYIPVACTLKSAYVHVLVAGTLASGESTTISFRLNNTTDTSISTALLHSATTTTVSKTGLSTSCAAGDYFEIKMAYPAFATNPTNCQYAVTLYFAIT